MCSDRDQTNTHGPAHADRSHHHPAELHITAG